MGWTDIHSHILPGFDDGASSQKEFLSMARAAVEAGTSVMVATPHYDSENPSFEPHAVADAVRQCAAVLEAEGIPLALVPGVEVRISAGLFDLASDAERVRGLTTAGAGKYMLVDLPLIDMPLAADEILYRIRLHGVTPVLAHPERNRYLVEHPEAVRELVRQGVELQVDSGSLEGLFGNAAMRAARRMVGEGACRLIGSDAHEAKGRGPDMRAAARAVERLLGPEGPGRLMALNPGLVLEGKKLPQREDRPGLKSGTVPGKLRRRFR